MSFAEELKFLWIRIFVTKIRRLGQNRIGNTYESERKIVCQKTMTDGFQADKKNRDFIHIPWVV